MDAALILRRAYDQGEELSEQAVMQLLTQSALVQKLTADFHERPLFVIFRLVGLAEIPFIERLPYTQKLLRYVEQNLGTPQGFSYTGSMEDIVPCYNALLLEAYVRLGLSESVAAQNALEWIKRYQLFERNQETEWDRSGIQRHGGCLKQLPCFIGIGKTVRALITYQERQSEPDPEVEVLIEQGVSYMLQHRMFQRLSTGQAISSHITDAMFPQSYALSLTDLIYIVGKRQLHDHENIQPLLALLQSKELAPQRWKIDYIYRDQGYVPFETRRKASDWLSYCYPMWLGLERGDVCGG